jgi:hypothetical protein
MVPTFGRGGFQANSSSRLRRAACWAWPSAGRSANTGSIAGRSVSRPSGSPAASRPHRAAAGSGVYRVLPASSARGCCTPPKTIAGFVASAPSRMAVSRHGPQARDSGAGEWRAVCAAPLGRRKKSTDH